MRIPFFDYKAFCKDLDYHSLLEEVLNSGYLIGGPFVEQLEKQIEIYTGISHCVCVGNATDALEIIFQFLKLPINSKVIVPAHTMLATASAAKSQSLNPIPIDCDPNTLMVEIEQLKACDLKDVSAIMITQLNGVVAGMDEIKKFCEEKNITLIEDSAQGIGAFNHERHAGSWGIGGCLSFYPAKVMGCLGDGGALTTNNYELAQFARSIRDHGRGPGLEAINWGRNSRLDSLNARVIIERLKQLNNLIDKRRKLADIYFSHLKSLENKGILKLPPKYSTNSKNLSTFQNFEIRANHRDDLVNFLNKKNIGTIKQWGGFSIAHFSKLGYVLEDFPSVKDLFDKLLLLPLNHMMNEDQIFYIAKSIIEFYEK